MQGIPTKNQFTHNRFTFHPCGECRRNLAGLQIPEFLGYSYDSKTHYKIFGKFYIWGLGVWLLKANIFIKSLNNHSPSIHPLLRGGKKLKSQQVFLPNFELTLDGITENKADSGISVYKGMVLHTIQMCFASQGWGALFKGTEINQEPVCHVVLWVGGQGRPLQIRTRDLIQCGWKESGSGRTDKAQTEGIKVLCSSILGRFAQK